MKNLNLVHLNGLKAVEAVGRLGSLQTAASELGVSIGAVSQQVIKAEQQLGRPLFLRTAKGMVATDFALDILARLTDGFRTLSSAVEMARDRNDGILTISVAPVFAARWLVHRLGHFSELHPGISLRIDATDRLVSAVSSDIDLCIRVGKGQWPGMRCELILEQEVFPVCSPAMSQRLRQPLDILKLPAVIDGRAMFSWDVWLKKAGIGAGSPATRHVFNEASLCLDAAISGQGVMLAWQTLAGYSIEAGQLVVPFDIWAKTGNGHYFATPENARRNPRVDAFKRWMKDEIATDMTRLSAFRRA